MVLKQMTLDENLAPARQWVAHTDNGLPLTHLSNGGAGYVGIPRLESYRFYF
jgi:hypothetical protein